MNDEIYISLGGNVGDRAENLSSAIQMIARRMDIIALSSLYETEPWGLTGQPNFLNAVAQISYNDEPNALLKDLQEIETELGRVRKTFWGKRTIDIDILLFGKIVTANLELTIPHKYLLMRDFFIVPLLEIAPDIVHPVSKGKIADYEQKMPQQLRTIISIKKDEKWQDIITSLSKVR